MYYYYGVHVILITFYILTHSVLWHWYSFHAHLIDKESKSQRNYSLPSVTWLVSGGTWIWIQSGSETIPLIFMPNCHSCHCVPKCLLAPTCLWVSQGQGLVRTLLVESPFLPSLQLLPRTGRFWVNLLLNKCTCWQVTYDLMKKWLKKNLQGW